MPENKRAKRGIVAAYTVLFLLASFSLFYHLDDRLLWTDEAETALLAVNITRFGVPVVDDGVNDLSQLRSSSASAGPVWIWSPWLDEYLAAGSFLLLGRSTTAARLPFAAIALAALILLGWLAWCTTGDHEVAIIALVLTFCCVAFLLHSRQCRYYSILIFGQLWIVYGVQRILAAPSARSALHVAGGLTALFYCNYMAIPGNVIALGTASLLLRRRHPGLLPWLLASGAVFGLLALPWLLYAQPGGQVSAVRGASFLRYLGYYVAEIHYHVVSLAVFALPSLVIALGSAAGKLRSERGGSDSARQPRRLDGAPWLGEIALLCAAIVVWHLLIVSLTPDKFFRYITPLIPLLMLLAAIVIVRFVPFAPLRASLVLLLALSNVASIALPLPFDRAHSLGLPFPTFVASITREYRDRLEDVLEHLDGAARPGDSVYVDDPELPLIFYTGVRVIDAGASERARGSAPEDPLAAEQPPDWVFPTSPSALVDFKQLRFRAGPRYERVEIRVTRSPRGGNRPSPDAHVFFTSKETQDFVFYRRRGEAHEGGR